MEDEAVVDAPARPRGRVLIGTAAAVVVGVVALLAMASWPAGATGGWVTPDLEPGLVDVRDLSGIDYNPIAYRASEDSDEVELRGVIGPDMEDGSMRVVASSRALYGTETDEGMGIGPFAVHLFTLECGLRPEHITLMASGAGDVFGKNWESAAIAVTPEGEVYALSYASPQYGPNGPMYQLSFTMDNVRFHADGDPGDCGGSTTTTEATTTTLEETTTTTE